MFERFTQAARYAVKHAQTEARALQHPLVGTEHLLLAMAQVESEPPTGGRPADDRSGVPELLRAHGITADTIRAEIVRRVGVGPDPLPHTEADDAAALRAIGIDLDAVRRAIEQSFGPGALHLPPAAPPKRRGLLRRVLPPQTFSDRARKCLELSLREALALKHRFIAPEHLLLGILREGRGLGAQILHDAGVDLTELRTAAVANLRSHAA